MQRLGDRAYKILSEEINRGSPDNLAGELGRKIVTDRLDQLRVEAGEPLTCEELRRVVADQFPDFSDEVLEEAARVNASAPVYRRAVRGGLIALGILAFIWFANLPFPLIRWPVSKTVPILLFPSYMSMGHDYRRAIDTAEEAAKLLEEAATIAEIDLGGEKIKSAYKYLDKLPVWFLDFEPKLYCYLFKCSWDFSKKEYEETRKYIQQIEAKIIQEQYAHKRLNAAESALSSARQEYQQLKSGETRVIAAWQAAIDLFDQIPSDTLAGRLSKNRSLTAQKDFEQKVDQATREKRGTSLIAAAQQYAVQAVKVGQDPPHPVDTWEQAVDLWEKAILQLEKVPEDHSSYEEAQEKLIEYRSNLKAVKLRLEEEKESIAAMERAKELILEWRELTRTSDLNYLVMNRKLANIIYTLQEVKPGTTVNTEAQDLLRRTRYTRSQL